MEMGYNVLCEKPMALTVALAQEMCDTAKKTGKTLMIAHCMRFHEDTAKFADILRSGELGAPYSAEFFRGGGHRRPMGYENWFRDESLSGSSVLDYLIHDADLLYRMYGMPKNLSAVGRSVIEGTGIDACAVTCQYDDKFITMRSDWSVAGDKYNVRGCRVNCMDGYMFLDRTGGRYAFAKADAEGTQTVISEAENQKNTPYYNEIRYYISCLEKGVPVSECPPEESMTAVKIALAAVASAKNGGEKIIF